MPNHDWRELAEAARDEQDPGKLMQLIEDLNRALEKSANREPRDWHSRLRSNEAAS